MCLVNNKMIDFNFDKSPESSRHKSPESSRHESDADSIKSKVSASKWFWLNWLEFENLEELNKYVSEEKFFNHW